ncbi:MAG: hypothetical protein AB1633_11450, partial [Elusimicrobiota bacterium]
MILRIWLYEELSLNTYIIFTILCLTIYNLASSIDSLELMSVSAGEEKVNIGILDFRPLDDSKKGDLETEPHKIVASDLEFSGRFKVYYSSKPDPDLIKKYDLAAFIDGEYFIKKDKVTLNCYLNDAINFELIIGKKYQSSKNQLHSAVHRFSDEVVYRIFGEQGIAQSMIAYVV